jgi:hypothetical protein
MAVPVCIFMRSGPLHPGRALARFARVIIKGIISKIVCGLAVVLVAFVLVQTPDWYRAYVHRNALVAIYIIRLSTPLVVVGSLLLGVPSIILYRREHRRRDLLSFCLSVFASVLMIAEAVALWVALGHDNAAQQEVQRIR